MIKRLLVLLTPTLLLASCEEAREAEMSNNIQDTVWIHEENDELAGHIKQGLHFKNTECEWHVFNSDEEVKVLDQFKFEVAGDKVLFFKPEDEQVFSGEISEDGKFLTLIEGQEQTKFEKQTK